MMCFVLRSLSAPLLGLAVASAGACGNAADTADTGPTATRQSEQVAVGDQFVDPQGTYTIEVSDDWTRLAGTFVAEVEAWAVAPAKEGFAPNLNVLTQEAPDLDLDAYMELSVDGLEAIDGDLLERDIVEAGMGSTLGVIEYIGGGEYRGLHFLATVAVKDGIAVVATLTSGNDDFEQLRREVEPFLFTLERT